MSKRINLTAGVEAIQVRHCNPVHIYQYEVKDPAGDWIMLDMRAMRRKSVCPDIGKVKGLARRLDVFKTYYKGV